MCRRLPWRRCGGRDTGCHHKLAAGASLAAVSRRSDPTPGFPGLPLQVPVSLFSGEPVRGRLSHGMRGIHKSSGQCRPLWLWCGTISP